MAYIGPILTELDCSRSSLYMSVLRESQFHAKHAPAQANYDALIDGITTCVKAGNYGYFNGYGAGVVMPVIGGRTTVQLYTVVHTCRV